MDLISEVHKMVYTQKMIHFNRFPLYLQDVGMRDRTREVYKMYSRRSAAEVHLAVAALQAKYLVLAGDWCNRPHA